MKRHPMPLSYLIDIERREAMSYRDISRFEALVLAHLAGIVSEAQGEQAVKAALEDMTR